MNRRPQTASGSGDRGIRWWLEAPREWSDSSPSEFIENLFLALDLYGASRDDSLVPNLVEAYRVAVQRLPVNLRKAVSKALAKPVENRRVTVAGLIPIMLIEPDRGIVQGATFDILRYSRIEPSGKLSAEHTLFSILEADTAENSGAILAGLLLYSHPPLIAKLAVLRSSFDPTQTREVCLSVQGTGLHLVLEFLLDWFLEVAASDDEQRSERLCALAAALIPGKDLFEPDAVINEIHAVADPELRVMRYDPIRRWRACDYAREILPRLECEVSPHLDQDVSCLLMSPWRRLASR